MVPDMTDSKDTLAAPTKRFIAGAVCPRCGEIDRIVTFTENQVNRKECVVCGFNEALGEAPLQAEPETRITRQRKSETQAQPLRFYPSSRAKPG